MRDDERYPIALDLSPDVVAIPEVATSGPQDYANQHDKYYVPNDEATAYARPVHSPSHPSAISSASPSTIPDSLGKETVSGAENGGIAAAGRGHRICGLNRRTFWVVAAIATVLLVGAIVGGVVGGLKARDASNAGSPNGTNSTQTQPNGPLDASKRALSAAATSGSGKSNTMQIFYQDLATTDILYRLVWSDKAKAEQRTNLTVPPNQGTPLAITASNRTDGRNVEVNLFYLTTLSGNTTIAQAILTCPVGAGQCSTDSNAVISNASMPGIAESSGLAAVLLDAATPKFRVYFQAGGGFIWVLAGDNPSANGWSGHRIGGPAVPGSSIAASLEQRLGDILVAWIFADNGALRAVEYTDSIGARGGYDVDATSGSGFTTSSRLAACLSPTGSVYHIYYVEQSSGGIVAYYRPGTSVPWEPNQDPSWGKADSSIACVGWTDQLRLIYMNQGNLAMNSQDNTTWAKMQYI